MCLSPSSCRIPHKSQASLRGCAFTPKPQHVLSYRHTLISMSYMQFESVHGTLGSVANIEQRRKEACGEACKGAGDALHVLLLQHRCVHPKSVLSNFLCLMAGENNSFCHIGSCMMLVGMRHCSAPPWLAPSTLCVVKLPDSCHVTQRVRFVALLTAAERAPTACLGRSPSTPRGPS